MKFILFIVVALAIVGIGYYQSKEPPVPHTDPKPKGIVNVPDNVLPKAETKTDAQPIRPDVKLESLPMEEPAELDMPVMPDNSGIEVEPAEPAEPANPLLFEEPSPQPTP